ncbi:MAG: DUF2460 domain-containing protein [Sphingomonas sp.]|uniref:DUF2460 domain-containing protein n=1 Tax=Sphingomonas sp. TaxID=28214 RepID=UPI003F7FE561
MYRKWGKKLSQTLDKENRKRRPPFSEQVLWRLNLTIGFDFTSGAMPPGASLARGSTGARTNSSGLIVWEANNGARFDYDPVSHVALGILIEPAASNNILRSGEFDLSNWQVSGASIFGNAGNAPTGITKAERLVVSTANVPHYVTQISTITGPLVDSFYVKSVTARYIYVTALGRSPTDGATQAIWFFDLVAGIVITGGGGPVPAIIQPAPNSFFRISVTCNSASAASELRLGISNNLNQQTFVGNGTDDILIWGAQQEFGTQATSPIETTTTAATRAADILTLNWGLLGVGDGTITVRYTFDDNSTQDVPTTVAGGTSVVPTNLARPRIKSAVGLGVTVPDTLNNQAIFPILPGQAFPVTKSSVWSTQVATAASGRERRRKQWSYPRWRFKITHDVLRDTASFAELQRLWAFFNDKAGQYDTFSYFDPADSLIVDQPFGTGDGVTTAFQLMRTVSAGSMTFTEPVRSVAGLPAIKVGGVATNGFTLDATGQVTFAAAPAAGAALSWSGQFMFRVRFEQDELEAEQMMQTLWSQGGLTLVTVKQ